MPWCGVSGPKPAIPNLSPPDLHGKEAGRFRHPDLPGKRMTSEERKWEGPSPLRHLRFLREPQPAKPMWKVSREEFEFF